MNKFSDGFEMIPGNMNKWIVLCNCVSVSLLVVGEQMQNVRNSRLWSC